MPQAPSSPLHRSVSPDDITTANSPSSPDSSATGNLPGGTAVRARTLPRSRWVGMDVSNNPVVELYDPSGNPIHEVILNGRSYKDALKANPTLRHLELPPVQWATRELEPLESEELEIKKPLKLLESEEREIEKSQKLLESEELEIKKSQNKADQARLEKIGSQKAQYQARLNEIGPQKAQYQARLKEIGSPKAQLMEIARATQHVLEVRSEKRMDKQPFPILPAGDPYREFVDKELAARYSKENAGRAQIGRRQRLMKNVVNFLEEADLPLKNVVNSLEEADLPLEPREWSELTSEDIRERCSDEGYYVYVWTPDGKIEEPDSEEAVQEFDQAICEEWKKGKYDNERGATFINIDNGLEWIVWLEHDRRNGLNLITSEILTGAPSEVYKDLKKNRPDALHGLDVVLVAHPTVSNALHALKKITQQEAHNLLRKHADDKEALVFDLDFEEFGRFMHSRYPGVVVARYATQTLDVGALGAVLDASENSFLLMTMDMNGPTLLQKKVDVLCFNPDLPSLKASLDKGRMEDDIRRMEDDIKFNRTVNRTVDRTPEFTKKKFDHPEHFLTWKRELRAPLPQQNAPGGPQGNNSRLYNASGYDGKPPEFEKPSAILQKYVNSHHQIGIISMGNLGASLVPDDVALAAMTAEPHIGWFVSVLEYAGIEIESTVDLARHVYKTYGVLPEINAEFITQYLQSRNDTLPDNKKISVKLEVKWRGSALPYLGDDPKGYLIQYRDKGQLRTILIYKEEGRPVFGSAFGHTCSVEQLNDTAQNEGWWNEGPVSILHFEGEDVRPLVETIVPRQESIEYTVDNNLKRSKPGSSVSSTPSLDGNIPMRPAQKRERLDSDLLHVGWRAT